MIQISDSSRFEDFVDFELNGSDSELDDVDDSDADPDFEPEEPIQGPQEEQSSDDNSDEEPINAAIQGLFQKVGFGFLPLFYCYMFMYMLL